jgi:hypothetical protein
VTNEHHFPQEAAQLRPRCAVNKPFARPHRSRVSGWGTRRSRLIGLVEYFGGFSRLAIYGKYPKEITVGEMHKTHLRSGKYLRQKFPTYRQCPEQITLLRQLHPLAEFFFEHVRIQKRTPRPCQLGDLGDAKSACSCGIGCGSNEVSRRRHVLRLAGSLFECAS